MKKMMMMKMKKKFIFLLTRSLLDDIQNCIFKVQNDSNKIIANSVKKKLNAISKGKKNF